MIKEILDNIDKDFVLGLANALAIDVEWDNQFECNETISGKFNKIDGSSMYTEMMHSTFKYGGYKYLNSDDAIGVVIPYKKYDNKTGKEVFEDGRELEFIAILPNDNLHNYINNLTEDKLNNLYDNGRKVSEEFEIKLGLPRFKYDYEIDNFIDVLKELGIKEVFDPDNANLTGIMNRSIEVPNLYVGEAIHKAHIDLNEKGTKAAAITYFGVYKTSGMPREVENVKITFDRPFMYIIRDIKTKEMLFFGTVYEPNKWNGSTCDN